jgi:hypothetical protein
VNTAIAVEVPSETIPAAAALFRLEMAEYGSITVLPIFVKRYGSRRLRLYVGGGGYGGGVPVGQLVTRPVLYGISVHEPTPLLCVVPGIGGGGGGACGSGI